MSAKINMKDLLAAGVHYGHQTRRWNPSMRRFIFGSRNGIHIIDLQKTVKNFQRAVNFIESVTAKKGHVLFVGTKRQARDYIKDEALRSGMYYINHRWLGGTLTNFQTIRKSIHKLKRFEKMKTDGTMDKLVKKEALKLSKEAEKLQLDIGGIQDMPGMPKAIFVIDTNKEHIAVQEARKLGIPVIGVTDTNANPDLIDYPIPGNDDSVKAIKLYIEAIAEACIAGKANQKDFSEESEQTGVASGKFYDDKGHSVSVEKKKKNMDED